MKHTFVLFLWVLCCGVACAQDPTPVAQDTSVRIRAQESMTIDNKSGQGWAKGHPEAYHQGWVLNANSFHMIFDPQTRQIQAIDAQGGMILKSETQTLQGDQGHYHVATQHAWSQGHQVIWSDPLYTLTTQGIIHAWPDKMYGTASGPSCLHTSEGYWLWGHMMTLQKKPTSPSTSTLQSIEHAEVWGNVVALVPVEKGEAPLIQADHATYRGETETLDLSGHVKCLKDQHYIQGDHVHTDQKKRLTTVKALQNDTTSSNLCGALLYPQSVSSSTSQP